MRNQRVSFPYEYVDAAEGVFPVCVGKLTVEGAIQKSSDRRSFLRCQIAGMDMAYVKHGLSVPQAVGRIRCRLPPAATAGGGGRAPTDVNGLWREFGLGLSLIAVVTCAGASRRKYPSECRDV